MSALYERYRGRSYERVLSFPTLVHLISDAIVQHGGGARRSFERAGEVGELSASIQAAYGKLRRLPIPLSMAFLATCTDRLRTVCAWPACWTVDDRWFAEARKESGGPARSSLRGSDPL